MIYLCKGIYTLLAVVYTSGVKKFTGKEKEFRNGENMSNLKGISEKCADVLKMHEPLVVLDDVVVTADKEKLYIVSNEDGAVTAFELDLLSSEIGKRTDEYMAYMSYCYNNSQDWVKNNICGYGSKIYLISSESEQKIQIFDVKTFEKTYMDAFIESKSGGCGSLLSRHCDAYPQCNGEYIVYRNSPNGNLLYRNLKTGEIQYVRYENGEIVKTDEYKLLGTQIYFCDIDDEYVYDIETHDVKLIYEFDEGSELAVCMEKYCQHCRAAVTEFINGYQLIVAENEEEDTIELAKLNLSTGEMQIEELELQACRDEIGEWQLDNGHLYYITMNDDGYLVDCDLLSDDYDETIIEEECPIAEDDYNESFNVLGGWVYYEYDDKYHKISLKDGLHIICK